MANPFVYVDGLKPCALVLSCTSSFLVHTIAALQLPLRGWLLLNWLCSVRQHQIHLSMLLIKHQLYAHLFDYLILLVYMYVTLFFCLYVVPFLLEIPQPLADNSIEEHHFVSSCRDHAHRWQSDRMTNWPFNHSTGLVCISALSWKFYDFMCSALQSMNLFSCWL